MLHFLLLIEGLKLCAGLVRVDPDVLCIDNGKQRFAQDETFANAFENWEILEKKLDDVTEKYIEHLGEELGEEACTFWKKLEEKGISENLPCWAKFGGEWWPAKLINHFDPNVMNSPHWSKWVHKNDSLKPVQQLKELDDFCLVTYYDTSSNAGVVKIDKIQAFDIEKLDAFVKSLPTRLQDQKSFKDAVNKAKEVVRELAEDEDSWLQQCSSCCKVRRRLGVKEETGAFTCSNAKWDSGSYRYRACCVPERPIDKDEWERERKGKRSSETLGLTLAQFQQKYNTTKVYRVLDDMDLENLQKGEGLKSRAVHNGRERDENYNCEKNIANHVKGGCKNADDSFLISSSKSMKWTLYYAHKKLHERGTLEYTQSETIKSGIYPFVEIDLSKVDKSSFTGDGKIIDLSHIINNDTQCILRSEPGFENMAAKFAESAHELLIPVSIPREAIVHWFEFNRKGTHFQNMPTAIQRKPDKFETYKEWNNAVEHDPTYRRNPKEMEDLIEECKKWAVEIAIESKKAKPASKYTKTALFKVFKGPEQFRSSKGDDQSPSGVRKRESEDATVPAKKHKVSKKKSTIMTFLFIIVDL
jgi:hypothetical protein